VGGFGVTLSVCYVVVLGLFLCRLVWLGEKYRCEVIGSLGVFCGVAVLYAFRWYGGSCWIVVL